MKRSLTLSNWNTADMDAKGLAAAKALIRRDYRKGFGIK